MKRTEWVLYHGFTEEDMIVIDGALEFGGRIMAIFEMPLNYKIIKYNC